MNIRIPITCMLSMLLLAGCHDDNEGNATEINVSYYNELTNKKVQVMNKDTIPLNLFGSCRLYIDNEDFTSLEITADEELISIEKVEDYYLCSPRTVGNADVVFLASSETKGLRYLYTTFKTSEYSAVYEVTNNSYTVTVPDSSPVRLEILTELSTSRLPLSTDELELSYKGTDNGDFVCRRTRSVSLGEVEQVIVDEGTFVTDGDTYTLTGKEYTLSFSMEIDVYNNNSFNLKQDLTEEFRQRYPDNQVEEVTIVSNVRKE